ncbi:integrase family protein [Paraburkholderia sp. D15]|uniref:integrase family protein n=1 Tax=Paraburkholderia sp. D15 TaxID=2880218 RepID=UPI00247A3C60|nr:integrase family protein [Paraburkholderia sp. D15]WGS54400.1 integrase family protein [Paraburkholderia sp. D15]
MFDYPKKAKITQAAIDSWPLSDGKQITIVDTDINGFGIRIGATSKSFIVYKRVAGGAPKRVTLGKFGHITVAEARKLAAQKLSELTHGVDPNKTKKEKKQVEKQEKAQATTHTTQTVRWVLDTYKEKHIEGNKKGRHGTLRSVNYTYDYFDERELTLLEQDKKTKEWKIKGAATLSSWLDRPFRSITREEVLNRFEMYERAKPTRVKGNILAPIVRTHQVSFKFMSSAFNFVIARENLAITENYYNPFDILKAYKKWKPTNVRTNFVDVRKKEFGDWWSAVLKYAKHNPVISDYILFSLLQVGRSIDIAPLKFENVDFELGEVRYYSTKNTLDYIFPVTKLGMEILERRKKEKINDYVFGYHDSKVGHVTQDAKAHFANIAKNCGKLITHHDLRRTWGTSARLQKIDERTINFLLKHKATDINKHYLMQHYDEIKEALQAVEDLFVQKGIEAMQTTETTEDNKEAA